MALINYLFYKNAEYLQWDARHNDVEAYNCSKNHIGSIDPATLNIYKKPVWQRNIRKG